MLLVQFERLVVIPSWLFYIFRSERNKEKYQIYAQLSMSFLGQIHTWYRLQESPKQKEQRYFLCISHHFQISRPRCSFRLFRPTSACLGANGRPYPPFSQLYGAAAAVAVSRSSLFGRFLFSRSLVVAGAAHE